MFKYILISLLSFFVGIGATIFIAMFYFLNSEEKEFSAGFEAALTTSSCPSYLADNLVGLWKGETTLSDGTEQEWYVERKQDGTYQIEFILKLPSGVEKSHETGLWAYSGCLYSIVTKTVNETPVVYQEVYRLLELDSKKMTYTNFRTGNTFTVHKVSI